MGKGKATYSSQKLWQCVEWLIKRMYAIPKNTPGGMFFDSYSNILL